MKILIIEDEIVMLNVMDLILQDLDCEITTSSTGLDALVKLADINPDLVITDVNLPDLSGFELLNLSKSHFNSSVPFICISGLDDPEIKSTALKLGAHAFFSKPIDPIKLVRYIRKLSKE